MFLNSSIDFLLETVHSPMGQMFRFSQNLLYPCSLPRSIRDTLEIKTKGCWTLQRSSQNLRHATSALSKGKNQVDLGSKLLMDSWAVRSSWELESWISWYEDRKALASPGVCSSLLGIWHGPFTSWEFWGFWRLSELTFQLCYLLTMWLWASYLTIATFIYKQGIKLHQDSRVFERIKLYNTHKITRIEFVFNRHWLLLFPLVSRILKNVK